MNIKDPDVHRMAKELAERGGTTVTGAVRDALRAALARERDRSREGMADRLMEIGRRSAEIDAPWLADDDLYDESGIPRDR